MSAASPSEKARLARKGACQARHVGGGVEGDVTAGEDAGEDGQLPANGHEVHAQRVALAEHADEHHDGEQQKRQGAALHERLEVRPDLVAHARGGAPEIQTKERDGSHVERHGMHLEGLGAQPDQREGNDKGDDEPHGASSDRSSDARLLSPDCHSSIG